MGADQGRYIGNTARAVNKLYVTGCRKIAALAVKIAGMREMSCIVFMVVGLCGPAALAQGSGEDDRRFQLGDMRSAAGDAVSQTRDGLGDAALAPLEDFNLRKDEIPVVLAEIEDPFAPLETVDCWTIKSEIGRLNGALGTPISPLADKPDDPLADQAADQAAKSVLGAVTSQARDLIPYRNIVRKVSGADGHAKDVRKAFERGAKRRAYLLGMEQAMACEEADPVMPVGSDAPIATKFAALSLIEETALPGDIGSMSGDLNALPPSEPTESREAQETSPPQWPPEG